MGTDRARARKITNSSAVNFEGSWNNLLLQQKYYRYNDGYSYSQWISDMRSGKTDGRFSVAIHGVESTISYKSITSMPGWYVIVEFANQDISDITQQFSLLGGIFGSILGRYGGDEFVVCLRGVTRNEAYTYMQEFQSWLTPLTLSTGEEAELSVSAGGAAYPNQGEDFVSLCRKADAALYEVKRNGKGDFRMKD